MEQLVCRQPGPIVALRSEEGIFAIQARRKGGQAVITPLAEETAEQEIVLEGLALIRHIRRGHVDVRQGLTYGGGSRRSIFIRTREVSYYPPNLLRRRIEIRRCRLYFFEGV